MDVPCLAPSGARTGSDSGPRCSTSSACASPARSSATCCSGRGSVEYPFYLEQDALRQISPVADQNLGGAIIALEQSILLLALFAWLYTRAKPALEALPSGVPEDIPAGVPAGAPSNGSLEPTAPPAAVSAAGYSGQDR